MNRTEWAAGAGVRLADMLVHEAGHAVIAWELGIQIVELRFSMKDWSGRMPFAGAAHCLDGDVASERAREAAEKDMLIFHAGRMAQLLFHYDSVHGYRNSIDLKGIMDACRRVEEHAAVIDAWSDYIEERVRVMLYQPSTWGRIIALAPEIARRLVLTGDEIAAFLTRVDVSGAVSPRHSPWNREHYAIGRGIDALQLSNRARSCLERSDIESIAHLVSYSAEDVRGRIWRAGAKTAREIEAAMRAIGLTLAEESLWDRELRVDRARRGNVVAL
jgi:hypothetical protein